MELELKFAELACCEPVGDLVTTQEESMETAIPEYCPDIARIVDTVGQLRLREKHPAGQQLTMGGSVVLTVLYTSEESAGLRSLSMEVPFSCQVEDKRLAAEGPGRGLQNRARRRQQLSVQAHQAQPHGDSHGDYAVKKRYHRKKRPLAMCQRAFLRLFGISPRKTAVPLPPRTSGILPHIPAQCRHAQRPQPQFGVSPKPLWPR